MDTIPSFSRVPHTVMENFFCLTNDYVVGAGSMQGWRASMEDMFSIVIAVPPDLETSFFGVFDGHGGKIVAEFLSKNMYGYVVSDPIFVQGDVVTGIDNAFLRLDDYLMNNSMYSRGEAGSTAIVVLIKDNTLYCANVGDSRAVAYVQGEVFPLSTDHKPMNQQERARIEEAGSYIYFDRINGDLALSRAFGDFRFKRNAEKNAREQAVIAVPEVTINTVSKQWEFVVLACDGIWEVMSNEQVCKFVKMRISMNMKPNDICMQLIDKCFCKDEPGLNGVGYDNMTVIIVVFCQSVCRPYLAIKDKPSASVKYICKGPNS